MRTTRTIQLFALLAIAVLVSCQPALFVPRYEPMAERPLAVLTGTLTVQDGCAWIVTPSERYLALWPSNMKVLVVGADISISADGLEVTAGDEVTVVGAGYDPGQTGFVESLIGQAVPDACRHYYWLVTELLPEPI